MLNLRPVIDQLKDDEFNQIADRLQQAKADKFLLLLNAIRHGALEDEQIREQLGVNQNAFYVLKSRLFEKIQDSLIDSMAEPRSALLKKSSLIPTIAFEMPKDKAIAMLTKMEKEYKRFDLPYELTSIYRALKKLHQYSDKHYHYAQQYNKHMAYMVSLDKAEDLMADFMRRAAEYLSSRQEQHLQVLALIKQEMANTSQLYASHHLTVYRNIVDVTAALFLPMEDAVAQDDPVEDLLQATEAIFAKYPRDIQYPYLQTIVHFLWFRYYQRLGVPKKAGQYFDLVNGALPRFLDHHHYCLCSQFLRLKVMHYQEQGRLDALLPELEEQFSRHVSDVQNIPAYTDLACYRATAHFYAGHYAQAAKELNQLLNDVSFKHHPHYDLEVKLFLALCYVMETRYNLAWNLLRNVLRKVKEWNQDGSYEHAILLIKLLRLRINSNAEDLQDKLLRMARQFELLNQPPKPILTFLRFDRTMVQAMVHPTNLPA